MNTGEIDLEQEDAEGSQHRKGHVGRMLQSRLEKAIWCSSSGKSAETLLEDLSDFAARRELSTYSSMTHLSRLFGLHL